MPRCPFRWAAVTAVLAATTAGCGDNPAGENPPLSPVISTAEVAALPASVLGAVVTLELAHAESVTVRFQAPGSATGSTPIARLPAGSSHVELPVLGLRPDTEYALQVVAFGGGDSAVAAVAFSTGSMPADLPSYQAGGPDPSPGLVAFSTGPYGVVIDNTGRVVWYVQFPGGPSLNFQAQPNGHYIARPATVPDGAVGTLIEIDPLGRVVRRLDCADGLTARMHDVRVERDDGYWLLCDEERVIDLTQHGGVADARVIGTVVQHVDALGVRRFRWSAFDHLDIADLAPELRSGPVVNWTHGNSLDLDGAGHAYVSFRELHQVVQIDTASGAVTWRFGGVGGGFNAGGALPFQRQHGVRITPSGMLVVLDNSGESAGSRVELWVLDGQEAEARLTGLRTPIPDTRANLGGSTQLLPGGRILASYGDGGRVEEYDAEGRVAWAITGSAGYVFRAQRIQSLYHPEPGLPP